MMKKTELKYVYCVPKTEEWTEEMKNIRNPYNGWGICGVGMFNRKNRTEIPVSKFIDLLEDKIVGWRLEEIGANTNGGCYEFFVNGWNLSVYNDTPSEVYLSRINGESERLNIKTFTELLQLLKFLNYEVNGRKNRNERTDKIN